VIFWGAAKNLGMEEITEERIELVRLRKGVPGKECERRGGEGLVGRAMTLEGIDQEKNEKREEGRASNARRNFYGMPKNILIKKVKTTGSEKRES